MRFFSGNLLTHELSPGSAARFSRYWNGQTSSFLAYNMLTVAVGWQVYDLTRSALSLGLVGLAQFLPQFLLTLPAGHLADRYDRRGIIMACQAVEALVALALAAGSLAHILDERLILAGAFLIGAARAFEIPSIQAVLPSLVEPVELPHCLALAAAGRQTGVVLGPALGG
jgi:MFS family permease